MKKSLGEFILAIKTSNDTGRKDDRLILRSQYITEEEIQAMNQLANSIEGYNNGYQ